MLKRCTALKRFALATDETASTRHCDYENPHADKRFNTAHLLAVLALAFAVQIVSAVISLWDRTVCDADGFSFPLFPSPPKKNI